MSKRYTEEYKNTIVELYNSGKTLAEYWRVRIKSWTKLKEDFDVFPRRKKKSS